MNSSHVSPRYQTEPAMHLTLDMAGAMQSYGCQSINRRQYVICPMAARGQDWILVLESMWGRAYRDEPLHRQLPPTAAATQEARPHSNLRRLDRQNRPSQALGLTKGLMSRDPSGASRAP